MRSHGKKQMVEKPRFLHFALAGLMESPSNPDGVCMLVLNLNLGTLARLGMRHEGFPTLLQQQQFPPQELSILLPLLRSYPLYCLHEILLASFEKAGHGEPTEEDIRGCQQRLMDAEATNTVDHIMRPTRGAIHRAKIKAHELGLEIVCVPEHGYLLRRYDSRIVPAPPSLGKHFVEY